MRPFRGVYVCSDPQCQATVLADQIHADAVDCTQIVEIDCSSQVRGDDTLARALTARGEMALHLDAFDQAVTDCSRAIEIRQSAKHELGRLRDEERQDRATPDETRS